MSYRIFNGCRMPSTVNLGALLRDLTERIEVAQQRLMCEAVAEVFWTLCPNGFKEDTDTFKFLFTMQDLIETCTKSDSRLNHQFCMDFEVVFLSDPDDPEWTYANVFATHPDLHKVWEATPGVEEYGYWDSSDAQLAVMTEDEWHTRKETWQRIIGGKTWDEVAALRWKAPVPFLFEMHMLDENRIPNAVARYYPRYRQSERKRAEFAASKEGRELLAQIKRDYAK